MPLDFDFSGIIIFILFFITPLILCIVSLVDIMKSRFEGSGKLVWLFAVILFPFAGAAFYFSIGRKQKKLL